MKTKVLYFLDRFLHGGIQTFVIENVKHIDKTKVQVDFLILDDGNVYELENTVKNMGCTVYRLDNIWVRRPMDYVKYYKAVNKFFSEHNDYKVVHLHSSSKNFPVLAMAKKYGVKIRVAHSHNINFQTESKIQKVIGDLFKVPLKYYATDYFACSYLAGVWLFGKKIADNKLVIVKNAVDFMRFKYDSEKSKIMKKELDVENNFVVGHVGRFTHQKNHKFLVDVFSEIVKKDKSAKLLLVGEGILENDIKEQVKKLGIENNVIFAGYKSNVEMYMQAMDVFLFPSEFEGLGLVLVEAQAAGLYCFTSKDVVPKEVKLSELLEYISLDEKTSCWADRVLDKKGKERYSPLDSIKNAGYDIKDTAKFLENFYLNS